MRRYVFTFLLCFVAGGSLLAVEAIPAPDQQKTATATNSKPASVEGWLTDRMTYALAGAKLPAFSARQNDGRTLTSDALRNRWTILGVWTTQAPPAGEIRYATALNSAVDQDPDLDLLVVHRKSTGALLEVMPPWPVLFDDGSVADAISPPARPFYLLVGPDLTIHAYRGALSADPDGIKPVIRGVAEIRKNAAQPR